jgi:cytosolic phospholipase A2
MRPETGIAVVYFPFLSDPTVDGVDPATSPFMSTHGTSSTRLTKWRVESVVALAKANFERGREQTERAGEAVYERKKRRREGAGGAGGAGAQTSRPALVAP